MVTTATSNRSYLSQFAKSEWSCINIVELEARDVFHLNVTKYCHEDLCVDAAFFEIYSGKVFDLLNKKTKLRVLEDGKNQVQVVGLRHEPVHSVEDVLRLLKHGADSRTSGITSANQHSSRSHAVFQECIRALGRKGAHRPFRASKLTQVLRDSFIGDRSRTCMIAMISPGISSCEHTLNTLRYADRVKELGPANINGGTGNGGQGTGDANYLAGQFSTRGPQISRMSAAGGGGRGDPSGNVLYSSYNGSGGVSLHGSSGGAYGGALDEADYDDENDDDDLAMLRSANDGEVSEELFNFHEVVRHIEQLEEDVCDDHATLCNNMVKWTTEHQRLLKETMKVPYDVEAYASRLEELLSTQANSLLALKDKVSMWRREMRQEEEISTKLKKGRRN
ncbi:unnamed protein product [Rodentolepis nana]|uniref:Kinesin-like protein n=1 Tax=Rodentolepis nana TaxID=102285 RepID=A0A0R3T3A2_RODNA|nr:unnamed protein product [Rodentolepis nana]